ncbi:troponin I [Galendromus occidentalis]|uniref:Troponin I n=1 Tax=Galendromus occidentalis TaxID=34638 RepID=A0AAJ6W001_9ACAR|nr:troponin I [Galendromus occidentalis]
MDEAEKAKMQERERKKVEVRKRLEEASKLRGREKLNKGFMTAERKKKLRKLLRDMNSNMISREYERRRLARDKAIKERCGQPKNLDGVYDLKELQAIVASYHARIVRLEEQKYDLEYEVRQKDFLHNEMTIQVNELRGKFVRPILKKVSKFDKLKKSIRTAEGSATESLHFSRQSLKTVKKKVMLQDEKTERPEWAAQKSCTEGSSEQRTSEVE